ncbi:DUF5640 domain-containing protein [Thermodesulfobacteriota bacterium]
MLYKLLMVIGLACFIITGCSSNVETEIIGEWKSTAPKQTLVFHQDGTVEMKSPSHSTYSGSYTIQDSNKLTFIFPSLFNPKIEREAKIRGEKLILLDPGGREEVYVKQ